MRRYLPWAVALIALLGLTLGALFSPSHVQAIGGSGAQGKNGKVTLAAATATLIPTTAFDMRSAIAIQNLDSVEIWCGFSNSNLATTGWKVAASGGVLTVDVSGRAPIYCYSAAGQTAPADTRYIEVRQ